MSTKPRRLGHEAPEIGGRKRLLQKREAARPSGSPPDINMTFSSGHVSNQNFNRLIVGDRSKRIDSRTRYQSLAAEFPEPVGLVSKT
jgi:hypothetical protein